MYIFKKANLVLGISKYIFLLLFVQSIAFGQVDNRVLIDPVYARGGTISDLADEITFIPLETTKESTFGIVQSILTSKNYIVFYDVTTKAIFVFYKNGKFKGKINELPGVNKETINQLSSLENFVLEPNSENIYVLYELEDKTHSKQLAVFEPDGKLIQTSVLNEVFNNLSTAFVFLNNKTALFTNYRGKTDSDFHFHVIKQFQTINESKLKIEPSDLFNYSWSNEYRLQSSSVYGSIWSRLYDNDIRVFDDKGGLKTYKLLFPASVTLDSMFYTDKTIIGNRLKSNEYLSDHRDKISYLSNLRKLKNWFSFTVVRYNMSGPKDVFLYNFERKDLYCLGRVVSDSISFSIPIFNSGAIVVGSDSEYMYLSVPSFTLFNTIKNLTNKLWETNEVLNTYMKSQNQKSNPVLVRLKLKKS